MKNTHGLVAADHHVFSINEIDTHRKLRTAYIGFGSDLIGTKMSENEFEQRTNMVLVAVARQGHRVDQQPREVVLNAGDSLLFECPPKNDQKTEMLTRGSLTFFDSNFVPQIGKKTVISAIILITMFVISSMHLLPLMACTMLAAGAMLVFKCCKLQKVTKYVEWELRSVLDLEGKYIPKRVCLRNICTHRYRIWRVNEDLEEGGQFDYSCTECPYTGTVYFNKNGERTNLPSEDSCGKKLSDCKKRFGETAELPFGGFPGMTR